METYQDLEEAAMKLKEYKGIFWAFCKKTPPNKDVWMLADGPNFYIASVAYYNADIYRIDEAMEDFRKNFLTK